MDSSQFAKQLVRRSYEPVQDLVDTIYAKIPEPLSGTALVEFLQTHMWREYMIGCHCPAKEMTMLPDSDLSPRMPAMRLDDAQMRSLRDGLVRSGIEPTGDPDSAFFTGRFPE